MFIVTKEFKFYVALMVDMPSYIHWKLKCQPRLIGPPHAVKNTDDPMGILSEGVRPRFTSKYRQIYKGVIFRTLDVTVEFLALRNPASPTKPYISFESLVGIVR